MPPLSPHPTHEALRLSPDLVSSLSEDEALQSPFLLKPNNTSVVHKVIVECDTDDNNTTDDEEEDGRPSSSSLAGSGNVGAAAAASSSSCEEADDGRPVSSIFRPIQKQQQKRRVFFDQNPKSSNLIITVVPHLPLQEYTTEEIISCWYTSEEFQTFRMDRKRDVKRLEQGCTDDNDDTDTVSYRGLESKTREGSRRKNYNVNDALTAVFDEQDRLDEEEESEQDEDERRSSKRSTTTSSYTIDTATQIALVYRQYTKHCLVHAQQRALKDQQDVEAILAKEEEKQEEEKQEEKEKVTPLLSTTTVVRVV